MKQELIDKIEGGNRWTKGKYDRLYFDDSELGLKIEHYKTGYISSAEIVEWPYLEGADMETVNSEVGEISNSYARAITGGKHYIDLDTGKINSFGFFEARIEYLILKAKKALEAEGKSAEGEDPAMSEMKLAEFKDWVINEFVKERIDDYFTIPTFLTEKYTKDFLSVKISDNKEFALVEVEIKRKGNKRGGYIWRLAVNLKRKRFDIAQSFHKSENGEIEERSGVFETNTDRQMKEFENTHIWTEWTDTPDDPNDPTSTKKDARKMTETEAVEALTEATTAETVRQVLKKTKKNVLLKLSRAVENITGTHVKCNAGRSTLERILLQNAKKLVGIDWQSAGKALEEVRRMRKWSDEKVERLANADNLHDFTKRQLTVLVKAWSIDIKKSATKAEMLLALMVSEKIVIKKQEENKMLSQEQIREIAEKAAKEVVSDRWGARYKEVKELQEEVKECAEELARIAAKVVTDEDEGVVMEALVSTEKTQWWWRTRMSAEDYLKDRLKIEAEIKRDAERRYREDMENPTLNRLESLRKEAEAATDTKALHTISGEVEKLADDIIEKLGHAYYTKTVRCYYWKAHNAIAMKCAALKNRKPQSIVEALEGRENVYDNF